MTRTCEARLLDAAYNLLTRTHALDERTARDTACWLACYLTLPSASCCASSASGGPWGVRQSRWSTIRALRLSAPVGGHTSWDSPA